MSVVSPMIAIAVVAARVAELKNYGGSAAVAPATPVAPMAVMIATVMHEIDLRRHFSKLRRL
jgi:hypothetical protein